MMKTLTLKNQDLSRFSLLFASSSDENDMRTQRANKSLDICYCC